LKSKRNGAFRIGICSCEVDACHNHGGHHQVLKRKSLFRRRDSLLRLLVVLGVVVLRHVWKVIASPLPRCNQLVQALLAHALVLVLVPVLHWAKNLKMKNCFFFHVLANVKNRIETIIWIDLNVSIQ
jgi:hypothetical protein